MEWHRKMEESRLQELKNGRELVAQKEENQYLKNLVAEQERSISSLEHDIVQQNMVRREWKKSLASLGIQETAVELKFQHSVLELDPP